VRDCDSPDASRRKNFEQPVLQTAQMFIGEMGCWLVYGLMKLHARFIAKTSPSERGYEAVNTDDHPEEEPLPEEGDEQPAKNAELLKGGRVVLLALPAICDILATTLMNVGLLLVAASIYQMTRGALVLFVGLLSVLFLRRHLYLFQWLSLVGVVIGVAIVGLAGALWPDDNKTKALGIDTADGGLSESAKAVVGVLLIAGAQIFTASQFVLEEWILENSPVEPIKVVGWEGIFGFVVTVLFMIIMHLIVGRTEAGRYGYFDMVEGWRQMTEIRKIGISSLLIMVSIG
jgi:drug/metabolite transporter (DMT)-like permease